MESTQEEGITIANTYAPNKGVPQYIRQMLIIIKGEIYSNTITPVDFNTPLLSMDKSSRQKINKETQALNDILDQVDLIDIFRTFIQMQKNTLSSQVHMEHSPG